MQEIKLYIDSNAGLPAYELWSSLPSNTNVQTNLNLDIQAINRHYLQVT